jgi:hypothetical protein
MPNRLQWWRDRLTQDYALIGACIVAVLLAALICFLWIAPDLAMYFATGLIRLPPGSRSSTAHVFARVVSEIGQAATTSPGRNEDRDVTPPVVRDRASASVAEDIAGKLAAGPAPIERRVEPRRRRDAHEVSPLPDRAGGHSGRVL